jgi:type I restriction enzyme S subunit
MSMQWPLVCLGDLLRLERRPVKVEPERLYQEIGIYCFGRGIFHKSPRTGLEVGDKALFGLKTGDIILQITFAWEGAVAVVSPAEEGMFGSTRYRIFRVDQTRCLPQFLVHYFKTEEGLRQLIKISPGSAGRNRVLSIKRIPEVLIPLPPLDEQKRIVERIDVRKAAEGETDGGGAPLSPEQRLVVFPALS